MVKTIYGEEHRPGPNRQILTDLDKDAHTLQQQLSALVTEKPFKPFFGAASDGKLEDLLVNEEFEKRVMREAAKILIKGGAQGVVRRIKDIRQFGPYEGLKHETVYIMYRKAMGSFKYFIPRVFKSSEKDFNAYKRKFAHDINDDNVVEYEEFNLSDR